MMKLNLNFTLLSATAVSLTMGIALAETQQNPASIAYVNAEDINVEEAIIVKGGTVPASANTCRKPDYGAGTPASIAYVNACDQELFEAIEKVFAFEIGDFLCEDNEVCEPDETGNAWGMVIYNGPNPYAPGKFHGIAMALQDQANTTIADIPWSSVLTSTAVNADFYTLYGGMQNTQRYCDYNTATNGECHPSALPPSPVSAFSACTTYTGGGFDDWYLPSTFETMQMFMVAQQMTYGNDAQSSYKPSQLEFFVNFTADGYWSSTENNGFGVSFPEPPSSLTSQALTMYFSNGHQTNDYKPDTLAVRCVRALPI